jgi:hypothetical protein
LNNILFQPRIAFPAAAIITAMNVLVAAGFSVAGLVAPAAILPSGAVPGAASALFALYAAARALPLALFVLAAIYKRSTLALLVLGWLAGVIQFLDAGIGLAQGDLGKSLGPAVIGTLQMAALWALERSKE